MDSISNSDTKRTEEQCPTNDSDVTLLFPKLRAAFNDIKDSRPSDTESANELQRIIIEKFLD